MLVIDNAGWHISQSLKVPDNITLFRLPPYSPELNPIERLWAYFKSHYLGNRILADYDDDLFAACKDAWNQLDESRLRSLTETRWLTHEVQA